MANAYLYETQIILANAGLREGTSVNLIDRYLTNKYLSYLDREKFEQDSIERIEALLKTVAADVKTVVADVKTLTTNVAAMKKTLLDLTIQSVKVHHFANQLPIH